MGLAVYWRAKATSRLAGADGQSNEQQTAPLETVEGAAPIGLAEWKRFELELEQARRETAEVERQVWQADDPRQRQPDPVIAIESELQLLERQHNAPAL